jgi:hypothetical protein
MVHADKDCAAGRKFTREAPAALPDSLMDLIKALAPVFTLGKLRSQAGSLEENQDCVLAGRAPLTRARTRNQKLALRAA